MLLIQGRLHIWNVAARNLAALRSAPMDTGLRFKALNQIATCCADIRGVHRKTKRKIRPDEDRMED
jgi:hypothetical protein